MKSDKNLKSKSSSVPVEKIELKIIKEEGLNEHEPVAGNDHEKFLEAPYKALNRTHLLIYSIV